MCEATVEELTELFERKVPVRKIPDLIKLPSLKEIKDAVFSIRDDKSPGSNGFSSHFFK